MDVAVAGVVAPTRHCVVDYPRMVRWLAWSALWALGCSNDPSLLLASSDTGGQNARAPDASQGAGATDAAAGFDEAACRTCLQRMCGELERACLDDATCASEDACIANCSDPACRQRCYAPGSTPFWELEGCR